LVVEITIALFIQWVKKCAPFRDKLGYSGYRFIPPTLEKLPSDISAG
jgi:hypothetical protein